MTILSIFIADYEAYFILKKIMSEINNNKFEIDRKNIRL